MSHEDLSRLMFWLDSNNLSLPGPAAQNGEYNQEQDQNEKLRLLALQASRSDNPYEVLKSILDPTLGNLSKSNESNAQAGSSSQVYYQSTHSPTYPTVPTSGRYDDYPLIPSGAIPSTSRDTPANTVYNSSPSTNMPPIHDDKRRRNTLASARFRDRKKQRENALETIVERLKSQSEMLEGEASNLRKENNWLLSLLELDSAKQALQKHSSGKD
ncbi:hypothetical protein WALSEDRAFT_70422 [Wallemia mellicola CBS 633.66]|uniref:BZIP domain-containing protein n=1 Tax=Wallemia mellicola (strain ATCC MYA-4683 / CBS 633.66) TaxID=671144 RepID=I4Y716_WALMC|nr:hypothetical protein WALSEDRAFT_70422 [Wallemia mellicola CBS 633.66]EIM19758.1 hypothetical protein WALSEDRAFT_70422 [Wallemia mellicola CBS 633.66]|eukprot:XP_006960266.1 hypothetical protein WALSEDRAFT_70422 [Wallemia mellicola CBS 633.66]